ncbi:hypothetical protein Q4574_05370 [Aliiglaciecola sp. 3_MG-2023]|uniref:hypothetical protein n=1 Tax=Aliiglaciecola sp. 3_MG-2023 TaxID=3062644 RepID=UPI0026E13FC5|nr:hypothetical protein [Aliiglaciecola sp. 3_MG-2023]MDO6692701.1 hypothetical protein [Aliiglaciecola sp. 3_MG-2023]
MRLILTVIFITVLSACASQNSPYQGENLVLPSIQELKSWQLFQKQDHRYRSNMWQKKGQRWADTFAVSIYDQLQENLQQKRIELDAPGKSHCQAFESINMTHPKINNIPFAYWQTRCEVNGKVVARMIHLMMQGQESFYHIQKVWAFDVEEPQFLFWKQQMDDTFLCNLAASDHTCPLD